MLLARSTIRVGVRCTAVTLPGVHPHPLQSREPRADGLGDDRLDGVPVAHGHPHRVGAVLGLHLGVERTHATDDAGRHLRQRLRPVAVVGREGGRRRVVLHDAPQGVLGGVGEGRPVHPP